MTEPTVANEVFEILLSFDYTVRLYDDEDNRVTEPAEARRMYAGPENLLVSLGGEDGIDSILLFIGANTDIGAIAGLRTSLRVCALKYGIDFGLRRYGREIHPKHITNDPVLREAVDRISSRLMQELRAFLAK